MNIEQLPKIDLHCHLDGSLTKTMIERHLGRTVPEEMLTVSEDCRSLTEYLEKFDLPVQCLQDAEGLEEGAYTFVKEISRENMKYIEVRFAPMLSVHENLSCDEVIGAVRKGMGKRGFQCTVRHHCLCNEKSQYGAKYGDACLCKNVSWKRCVCSGSGRG